MNLLGRLSELRLRLTRGRDLWRANRREWSRKALAVSLMTSGAGIVLLGLATWASLPSQSALTLRTPASSALLLVRHGVQLSEKQEAG